MQAQEGPPARAAWVGRDPASLSQSPPLAQAEAPLSTSGSWLVSSMAQASPRWTCGSGTRSGDPSSRRGLPSSSLWPGLRSLSSSLRPRLGRRCSPPWPGLGLGHPSPWPQFGPPPTFPPPPSSGLSLDLLPFLRGFSLNFLFPLCS